LLDAAAEKLDSSTRSQNTLRVSICTQDYLR
jgi:hypothetical protein